MKGKIFVIGSTVIDRIRTYDQREYNSFGGITYSVVALAKLNPDRKVFPVTYVGSGDFGKYLNALSRLQNVAFDYVFPYDASNENFIFYPRRGPRQEEFKMVTPPIEVSQIPEIKEGDAILVNFIKNNDLSHETLKSLSFQYDGILFIDIHSLLRVVTPQGKFVLKTPKNWVKWASLPDIIQMNRSEAHTLTGLVSKNLKELRSLGSLILLSGPKVVTITLGRKGSLTLWKEEGEVRIKRSYAVRAEVVDPTGAGDTYGAAFLTAILRGMNPGEAADFANQKASVAITGPGIEPLFSL